MERCGRNSARRPNRALYRRSSSADCEYGYSRSTMTAPGGGGGGKEKSGGGTIMTIMTTRRVEVESGIPARVQTPRGPNEIVWPLGAVKAGCNAGYDPRRRAINATCSGIARRFYKHKQPGDPKGRTVDLPEAEAEGRNRSRHRMGAPQVQLWGVHTGAALMAKQGRGGRACFSQMVVVATQKMSASAAAGPAESTDCTAIVAPGEGGPLCAPMGSGVDPSRPYGVGRSVGQTVSEFRWARSSDPSSSRLRG